MVILGPITPYAVSAAVAGGANEAFCRELVKSFRAASLTFGVTSGVGDSPPTIVPSTPAVILFIEFVTNKDADVDEFVELFPDSRRIKCLDELVPVEEVAGTTNDEADLVRNVTVAGFAPFR